MRTWIAIGILCAGLACAGLFRRAEPAAAEPAPPEFNDELVLRASPTYLAEDVAAELPTTAPPGADESDESDDLAPTSPLQQQPAPPPIAASYAEGTQFLPMADAALSAWSPQSDMLTHRVADGDTLSALARRYLGDASRASEIFEANRDVLSDPNALPIGVELKLPQAAVQ